MGTASLLTDVKVREKVISASDRSYCYVVSHLMATIPRVNHSIYWRVVNHRIPFVLVCEGNVHKFERFYNTRLVNKRAPETDRQP